MKRIVLWTCLALVAFDGYGQSEDSDNIIALGKHYSAFMFQNSPPKSTLKELGKGYNPALTPAISFIKEVTKSDNKLLTDNFLVLPDSLTLRVVFIIDALHQNPHKLKPLDPQNLVDSLLGAPIPFSELVDEYYSTLFSAVGNKNKPFNMSKIDFEMDEYNLNSDRLKGIFYLRCMDFCGTQISGYMRLSTPNTSRALEYIDNFPSFNHLDYFRYTDLYFSDFELEIYNDQGLRSFKDTYIDKLYSTLLNHVICLQKETDNSDAVTDLLLGSILKDSTLYKHTSHKATLEGIFKTE